MAWSNLGRMLLRWAGSVYPLRILNQTRNTDFGVPLATSGTSTFQVLSVERGAHNAKEAAFRSLVGISMVYLLSRSWL